MREITLTFILSHQGRGKSPTAGVGFIPAGGLCLSRKGVFQHALTRIPHEWGTKEG
jgi:hypothetical protein